MQDIVLEVDVNNRAIKEYNKQNNHLLSYGHIIDSEICEGLIIIIKL